MAITLDITGFYYSIDVDTNGVSTVLDVMNKAKNQRAPNGGVLDFDADNRGFVSRLSVFYDKASQPVSRQDDPNYPSPFGLPRPDGRYEYSDDVLSPTNRIGGSGSIGGLLAWQYYVLDSGQRQKNSDRKIIPAVSFDIVDGDRIVWRLVGIFGLNQFLDGAREKLVAESKGQPLSLKAAGRVLQETNSLLKL